MGLYALVRPLLFRLDPEVAHELTLNSIALVGRTHPLNQYVADLWRAALPARPVRAMGLTFTNPVGVAAGLDKDARAVDGLAMLGFGFLELGTVTPLPQSGNPKPRMFRLTQDSALINRMGFNGAGLGEFLSRLSQASQQSIIGINLGRNATTANEEAWRDYVTGLRAVYGVADYVSINISSPNTQGLRDLQEQKSLDMLLARLKQTQSELADQHGKYTPIVIKLAPDLDPEQLDQVAEALIEREMDGVIATNTTITRPSHLKSAQASGEPGGLSGQPLAPMAIKIVSELRQRLPATMPIIGAGGIHDATSAAAMLSAGASLIQIYTGLIYRGPALLRDILMGLPSEVA